MGKKTTLRRTLAEAQNWRCAYCAVELTMDGAQPTGVTIDHIAPRAAGGRDHWWNLVAACKPCNGARGFDLDVWTFWKVRARLADTAIWLPGASPPEPVREYLAAHRQYLRAKFALRRFATGANSALRDTLLGDLAETLEEGCVLSALQITQLPSARRRPCRFQLRPESRLAGLAAARLDWACLWSRDDTTPAAALDVGDDQPGGWHAA